MHELGIVYEVVRQVQQIVKEQNLTQVAGITLQIGAISTVVPEYIEKCYPAAVDGTIMENTQLHIEIMPANALCQNCGKVYDLAQNSRFCPYCQSPLHEVLSGKEFYIKEIEAC